MDFAVMFFVGCVTALVGIALAAAGTELQSVKGLLVLVAGAVLIGSAVIVRAIGKRGGG